MNKSWPLLAAAAFCTIAIGQTPDSGPRQAAGNPGTEDHAVSAPVLHIKSVEIIRSAHPPVLDIIRVRGVASTAG